MLANYLNDQNIHICDVVTDWQQAITLSGNPLLEQGIITQRYIDEIIAEHGRTGPYYVLAPGVAMPHSRPENGSVGVGLSLLVIKQGVDFGSTDNDPVKVIFSSPPKMLTATYRLSPPWLSYWMRKKILHFSLQVTSGLSVKSLAVINRHINLI